MNIYEKIDAIFQDDLTQKPQWADELFRELYEIKTLLKQQQTTIKKIDKNYYSFELKMAENVLFLNQNQLFL